MLLPKVQESGIVLIELLRFNFGKLSKTIVGLSKTEQDYLAGSKAINCILRY